MHEPIDVTRRALIAAVGSVMVAHAQDAPPLQWVCPMDPDVRSLTPDRCGKCGMQLVAGLPGAEEYPVDMRMCPQRRRPGIE
jgi:hypothetical protein